MMRQIGGKLFAPVFFVAVMAMMLIFPTDPSLTSSQINSIEGVFLSSDEWLENNNISEEIKNSTDGLPPAQQSVMMRRFDAGEKPHVLFLGGQDFASESGIERLLGNRYEDEEDLDDHEDPYAVGTSTVTPDEDEVPPEDWREGQGSNWTDLPYWTQVLRDDLNAFYSGEDVIDLTTIHPDEVLSVIEYTERVEEIRREEADEERRELIQEYRDAGELPPSELNHGRMPVYPEITRDMRRMNPDVVIIDLHLFLDHLDEGLVIEEDTNDINEIIRGQLYDFLNNLYRGNTDHFTTYILFPGDISERLGIEGAASLFESLEEQISQLTIYNNHDERQMSHLLRVPTYSETNAYRWTRDHISPLLKGGEDHPVD